MATRKKFGFQNSADALEIPQVAKDEIKQPETQEKSQVTKLLDKIEAQPNEYSKAFIFKFVPREKLQFHRENDYPMEGIANLADLILNFGLIHNIEVVYDIDNDMYIIDAGERRTRAIDLLIETYDTYEDTNSAEYKNYLKHVKQFSIEGYPCNVKMASQETAFSTEELALMDQINSHIRLIIANEATRESNPVRTREHIEKLNDLYSQRNALLTKGAKINVNKAIGSNLGISDRQVKNYKALSNLIPALMAEFEKNNISVKDGANYSRLSEDEQQQILTLIQQGKSKSEIDALYKDIERMNREIASSKEEIARLNKEKEATEAALRKAKEDAEELEKKISTNTSDDSVDREELLSLHAQLEAAQEELHRSEKEWTAATDKQEQIIANLNQQLSEKQAKATLPVDTTALRLSFQIEENLTKIETAISQLLNDYNEYTKSYNEKVGMKHPEEYRKALESVIKGVKIK